MLRGKQRFSMVTFLITTGFVLLCAGEAFAQDAGEERGGVVFNIAEDRRIERIGGVHQPEGLDKYMKRRFDELKAQIQSLESTVEELQAQMTLVLEALESRDQEALAS